MDSDRLDLDSSEFRLSFITMASNMIVASLDRCFPYSSSSSLVKHIQQTIGKYIHKRVHKKKNFD